MFRKHAAILFFMMSALAHSAWAAAEPGPAKQCRFYRDQEINAWKQSNNTVYLVYPETAKIPADRFGRWDKP
jgi:hypothetical protein